MQPTATAEHRDLLSQSVRDLTTDAAQLHGSAVTLCFAACLAVQGLWFTFPDSNQRSFFAFATVAALCLRAHILQQRRFGALTPRARSRPSGQQQVIGVVLLLVGLGLFAVDRYLAPPVLLTGLFLAAAQLITAWRTAPLVSWQRPAAALSAALSAAIALVAPTLAPQHPLSAGVALIGSLMLALSGALTRARLAALTAEARAWFAAPAEQDQRVQTWLRFVVQTYPRTTLPQLHTLSNLPEPTLRQAAVALDAAGALRFAAHPPHTQLTTTRPPPYIAPVATAKTVTS